jgi:hypothetical protein
MRLLQAQTLLLIPAGLLCGYLAAANQLGAQQDISIPPPPALQTKRPAPYLNRNLTPWPNQPQKGFHWSVGDIQNAHRLLAEAEQAGRQLDPNSTLHDFPFWTRTQSMSIYHVPYKREATHGPAQQHLGYAQFVTIMGGVGSVTAGGELQNATTLIEQKRQIFGELRGSSIKGGKVFRVTTGDVLSIPPDTPVQFHADSPGGLTYMVMKINAMLYPWELIR